MYYEGSYVINDYWKEGSKVQFLNPDKSGIYSIIDKHIPNKLMSFKHLVNVVNGRQQPIDDDTKKWSGTTETYTLSEDNGTYTLNVEIDVLYEHLDYMKATFLRALEQVKSRCV